MSDRQDPAGMAALSICEALLLALQDRNVLPDSETVGILRDAAETHEKADGSKSKRQLHAATADLINEILEEGNLTRKS
ncbi:hypothetical protein [Aestuariivita boseongensis]|uniref:hypothetical protein n=1 Tax=Aestuariivita boseongensis TaxID=1470562 RepID=UPI000682477F|nr:hypothetical protein [Aestuariivita boseongensis]